jgi:hypothetical protein
MERVGGRWRYKFSSKNNPILFVEIILPILGVVVPAASAVTTGMPVAASSGQLHACGDFPRFVEWPDGSQFRSSESP